ncbi:hypothetical protein QQF64_008212 [Cirrhinus molitorella]|uniref:Uncharacterized protein n=1 Tax=Cirrhinus molitorella TaxID=172907 RepID=A0ABR3M6C3_9TELE
MRCAPDGRRMDAEEPDRERKRAGRWRFVSVCDRSALENSLQTSENHCHTRKERTNIKTDRLCRQEQSVDYL